MSEKKYGYYSNLAANREPMWDEELNRYVYTKHTYKTPQGVEVLVTSVGSAENPVHSRYMWPDAKLVGEVTEWVRGVP